MESPLACFCRVSSSSPTREASRAILASRAFVLAFHQPAAVEESHSEPATVVTGVWHRWQERARAHRPFPEHS